MSFSMRNIHGFFRIYEKLLSKRPYLVQAIQTGALMGAGDLISQYFIENKPLKNVDYQRTAKFSSIGLFVGVIFNFTLENNLIL